MSSGRFIVCEGLDCSGKTTGIKKAIESIGKKAVYSKGLCSETFMGRIASKFPSTFLFLAEQLYLTYFVIRPNLKKGKIVLQDRYINSIECHLPSAARAYNKLLISIAKLFLLRPDILVNFTVSKDERIKRLKQKQSLHHKVLIEKPQLIELREEACQKQYKIFNGRKGIIDTTNMPVTESSEKLISLAAYT